MFETEDLKPTRPEDRTITIFLNRDCPRKCYQCGIADGSRRPMSCDDWKTAFHILRDTFGATFFLFLGVEPLVLKDTFVELVRELKTMGVAAAWYTTSPEPMFSKYRDALVQAGLENWSSGVDTLPHLPSMDPETDKKSREALIGLKWMAERNIPTHVTTTIHKKNLIYVPEIMEWIYQEVPGVEYAINFIHWRKDHHFDFMSPPQDMADMLWDGSVEEMEEVKLGMRRVKAQVLAHPERRFHTSIEYVENAHTFYAKTDLHCKGAIGPSVDADGTMRLCGYRTLGPEMSVFDLIDNVEGPALFTRVWNKSLAACPGCYWACFRLPQEQMTPHAHPLNVLPGRERLLQIGSLR